MIFLTFGVYISCSVGSGGSGGNVVVVMRNDDTLAAWQLTASFGSGNDTLVSTTLTAGATNGGRRVGSSGFAAFLIEFGRVCSNCDGDNNNHDANNC